MQRLRNLFSEAKANNHEDFGMTVQHQLDNTHFIDPTQGN